VVSEAILSLLYVAPAAAAERVAAKVTALLGAGSGSLADYAAWQVTLAAGKRYRESNDELDIKTEESIEKREVDWLLYKGMCCTV
jgi:hypothetical protein